MEKKHKIDLIVQLVTGKDDYLKDVELTEEEIKQSWFLYEKIFLITDELVYAKRLFQVKYLRDGKPKNENNSIHEWLCMRKSMSDIYDWWKAKKFRVNYIHLEENKYIVEIETVTKINK